MEALKERMRLQKAELKTNTVEQQKQKVIATKQKQQAELELQDRERQEKMIKKLKLQQDYYKTHDVQDVKIKRLDEVNKEGNDQEQAPTLLYFSEQVCSDMPPVERKEVQRRLRDLGQPITYFGESDWQRYKRLLQFEQKAAENKIDDADYLLKQQEEKQELQLQEGEDIEEIRKFLNKIKERNLDPSNALVPVFKQKERLEAETMLLEGVSLLTRCEDIYLWCKKILREWHIKLQEKFNSETAKRSLEGSQAFVTFKQTQDYIKPLTEQLQKVKVTATASKGINEEILNSLYLIVRFCVYKEYVMAHDKYLELAIGNAPWPMGVTMVGIHERTGRSKISSSQIAHILNDETQRKFIQAIKRLITISQKLYSNLDLSKMVDFRAEYAW